LLVYIHGFLGTETSFKSFPAHVHNLLTTALAQTHVVYTKIYPRYKSRKNITFARDDFSKWLEPRESDTTDIILAGHSLGGILAAEAILLPPQPGHDDLFQHRILGLIAFDTPFLGMHPSVVGTGIASLFRAPPQMPISPPPDPESFPADAPEGHNFNPAYTNDVRIADRHGKAQRFRYFYKKHADDLVKAASNYVSSHLEFGGCLADYPGLKRRYNAVRALEDVEEIRKARMSGGKLMKRVRFVNYYSASTGLIKEHSRSRSRSQSPLPKPSSLLEPPTTDDKDVVGHTSSQESLVPTAISSPRLSLEEHRDGEVLTKSVSELNIDPDPSELAPVALADSQAARIEDNPLDDASLALGLPPVSALPDPPGEFAPDPDEDEDMMKLLRKEHDRRVKTYERAVKDRDDTIKDREKLLAKRKQKVAKQKEKADKNARDQEARLLKDQAKRSATLNAEDWDKQLQQVDGSSSHAATRALQKDRKFCALPPKDTRTGKRDSTWVRVYFEGIDEVTAHTAMFSMSERYMKMVRDVVERIETWIAEDISTRMILAEDERLD
jgi:pimeloyl-ACP methyl ester carboxylesterase